MKNAEQMLGMFGNILALAERRSAVHLGCALAPLRETPEVIPGND
jgi:hypothetical protein